MLHCTEGPLHPYTITPTSNLDATSVKALAYGITAER